MESWNSIDCDRIELAVGDYLARMQTMDPVREDSEPEKAPRSFRALACLGLVLGVTLGSATYFAAAAAGIL